MNQFGQNEIYGFNLLNDPLLKTSSENFDFKYIKSDEFDRVIRTVENDRLVQSRTSIWQEFCDKCDKRTMVTKRTKKIPVSTEKKKKKRPKALNQTKSIFSKLSLPPKDSPRVELPKVRVMSETEIDAIISKAIADVMGTDQNTENLIGDHICDQTSAAVKDNEQIIDENMTASDRSGRSMKTKTKIETLSNQVSLKSLSLTSINGNDDSISKCSFDLVSPKRNEHFLHPQKILSKRNSPKPLQEPKTIPESAKSNKSTKTNKSSKTPRSIKLEESLNNLKSEESGKTSRLESRQESMEFHYRQFITPSEMDQLKGLNLLDELNLESNLNKNQPKTEQSSSTVSSKRSTSELSTIPQSSIPEISKQSDTVEPETSVKLTENDASQSSEDENNDINIKESVKTVSSELSDDLHITIDSNDSISDSEDLSESDEKSQMKSTEKGVNLPLSKFSQQKTSSSRSIESDKLNYLKNVSSSENFNLSVLSDDSTSSTKSNNSEKSKSSVKSNNSEKSKGSVKSNNSEKSKSSTNSTMSSESLFSDLSGKQNAGKKLQKKLTKMSKPKKKKPIDIKKTEKPKNQQEKPIELEKTQAKEMTEVKESLSIPKLAFLTKSENEEMQRLLGFSVDIPEMSFDQLDLDYEKQKAKTENSTSTESGSDMESGLSRNTDNDEQSDYYDHDPNNMMAVIMPGNGNSKNLKKQLETDKQNVCLDKKAPKPLSSRPPKSYVEKVKLAANLANLKNSEKKPPPSTLDSSRQSARTMSTQRSIKKVTTGSYLEKVSGDITDRSSLISPFNDEKKMIFSKITTHHKKIIEVLDNLRASVLQLSLPDGYSEMKRREKNIMEFTVRFQRNYLYPLERMIEEIRVTHSDDFTSKYTNSPCSKVCGIYALIQLALASYYKQIRHFILNNNAKKLNVLIKLIISCTDICCRKKIFHQNDEILTCLVERCHSFLQFLKDVKTPPRSARFDNESKPFLIKKPQSPKHLIETQRTLNMYEGSTMQHKSKRFKETGRKLYGSANSSRVGFGNQFRQGAKNNLKKPSTDDLKSSPSVYTEPESFITPGPEVNTHIEEIDTPNGRPENNDEVSSSKLTNRSNPLEKTLNKKKAKITESNSEITKRAVMEVVQSIAIEEVRNLLAPFVSNLGSILNQSNDLKGLELALNSLNALGATKNDEKRVQTNNAEQDFEKKTNNNDVAAPIKKKRTNFTNTNQLETPKIKNILPTPPVPSSSPTRKFPKSYLFHDQNVDENSNATIHSTRPSGDGFNNRWFQNICHDQNTQLVRNGEGEEGAEFKNKKSSESNVMQTLNYNSNIQYTFIKSEEDSEEKHNETNDDDEEQHSGDFNLNLDDQPSKESIQSETDNYNESSYRTDSNIELQTNLQGIFQDRSNFWKSTENSPLYCNDRFSEPWKLLTKMTRKLTTEILNQTDFSAALVHENYIEKLIRMELDIK